MIADKLLKIRVLINGSFAIFLSHNTAASIPTAPMIRGTREWKLDHEKSTPPQVRAIRKLVILAMKIAPPSQSMLAISCHKLSLSVCLTSRTIHGTVIKLNPQKGRLKKKIHLQVTNSEKRPPNTYLHELGLTPFSGYWGSCTHRSKDSTNSISD